MTRYGLVCLLLGSLSWGQEISSKSELAAPKPGAPADATPKAAASGQSQQAKTSNATPDAPAITINGLCDHPPAGKTAASNCKTVITQAQFEKVIAAVQPNMSVHVRREYALRYANALVKTKKAEQMGLDKGTNYEEQMKLARIQVLSKALDKAIQEQASQISDKDIEDYYHNNTARFEKAEMDRIYVPRTRQSPAAFDKKPSDADRQERSEELEQTMKEEADSLHARAVAGEEFGLVVCILIVGVFAFIVLRGFSRLLQEGNLFVVLAATGLLVQFGLQAAINMASTLHLMPTKGMTLPFISYGGSSMLALGLGMGMALALTRRRFGGGE